QAALHDALNLIDQQAYRPYLLAPSANRWDSKDAAVAAAAFNVLAALFPLRAPALQAQYDAYIASLPDEPAGAKAAGERVGQETAAAMLAARQNDGRFGRRATLYPEAPGAWRPTGPNFATDPASGVGYLTPVLLPNPEMVRSDRPNPPT